MAYDETKPVTGGALVAADVRENFRALKDDVIVNADKVDSFHASKNKLANTIPVAGANGMLDAWNIPYVHIRDEKTAGTEGGDAAAGWQTRTLNTIKTDTHNIVTLSANQFTLPAGTYRIFARAPAFRVDFYKAVLYNITDASYSLIGSSGFCGSGDSITTSSVVRGQFTISASKKFEIRHYASSLAGYGFGRATNAGVVEVYTEVELWKIG